MCNSCNLSADKRTTLLSQSDGGVEMMVTVDLKPVLHSRWGTTTVSCHWSTREKYSTLKARDAQSRCKESVRCDRRPWVPELFSFALVKALPNALSSHYLKSVLPLQTAWKAQRWHQLGAAALHLPGNAPLFESFGDASFLLAFSSYQNFTTVGMELPPAL